MLPALRSGSIDGYATSLPFTTEAAISGDAVMLASGLTDARGLLPFVYALLYAKPNTCIDRREMCVRLGRAFAAATQLVHDQPADVFENVLRVRFANMDVTLLQAAWQQTRLAHAKDIRVTAEQLDNSQKVSLIAGLLDPDDAFTSYNGLYTDEFVK